MQSEIPADLTPAVRIHEYMLLMRELSRQTDPEQLLRSYRARAQFVVPGDHFISLSRKDLSDGRVKITRTTRWEEPINPWKEPERLPIIDRGILCDLMRVAHPVKIDNLELADDDPARSYFDGMQSALAAPIFHEGDPMYMVVMLRARPAAFTLDELATLLLTANLIGRAASNLVLADELRKAYAALDREMHQVGEIQRSLLPAAAPDVPGLRIATYYETSTRAGGDYYDFLRLDDTHWGFLIADVSGHGPPAAVVMAMTQAFMRSPAPAAPDDPALPSRWLARVNGDLFRSLRRGQFVTAFLGVLDTRSREFSFASAGHPAPRLVRPRRHEVVPLKSDAGLPLGIVEQHESRAQKLVLSPGERLLLFTDGITETFNDRHEMFGTEGVDEALRRCSITPDSMIQCVLTDLRAHQPASQLQDDRTLVALAFD
ncbi:MAG: serine/threonine-protein phosphatase [Phycisphaerae bacterium]|nr:serine/threonine-protein phosphatase [Phycisphaerae bacterium]MCZ2401089.1 serine/threonine-protein phosphatase [Phycisphaerae bacterium]